MIDFNLLSIGDAFTYCGNYYIKRTTKTVDAYRRKHGEFFGRFYFEQKQVVKKEA